MKTENFFPHYIKEELLSLNEIIVEMAQIKQKLQIKIKEYEVSLHTCIANVRNALSVDNELEARYWLRQKYFYENELEKHKNLIGEFNNFTETINQQLNSIYYQL